ncbi:MAG: aspartate--tRNA ligase [Planctomycetota bacterium]
MKTRTHRCGDLRVEHVGQTVTVCGWVDTKRDRGGVAFILLRDVAGKVQLTFAEEINPELLAATKEVRHEFVITATGKVRERDAENKTTTMASGDIEIAVESFEILNTAVTPAIEVRDDLKCDPELRLKHRFIDLRRRPMQAMLQARAKLLECARETLGGEGFLEVETPVLYKRTPEGARDFIVPSRAHRGQFYALPQSPQLFKQLCMISGLDRYYQVARCFRDEDKRADRQPEFTQIDIEMSFPTRDDVMELFEKVVGNVFKGIREDARFKDQSWPVLSGSEVSPPFERMSYEQAMRDYSIDRPDLRSRDLKLTDLTGWAAACSFNAFKGVAEKQGLVKALRCPGLADGFSTGQLKNLERDAKGMGATGLANLKVTDAGLEGGIAKFIPEAEQKAMIEGIGAKPGDLLLICAHEKHKIVHAVMHNMRLLIAEKLGLHDNSKFAICWIIDFPLFEYREDDEKLFASHHPFTLPQDVQRVHEMAEACRTPEHRLKGLALLNMNSMESTVEAAESLSEVLDAIEPEHRKFAENPNIEADGIVEENARDRILGLPSVWKLRSAGYSVEEILALRNNQYDLVINGIEIAGGSIRMHRTDDQADVFELVGIGKEEADKKFGFLMSALDHGAPPHGGIASGVDRLLMLLLGLDNIQDVIAFPKSATGRDLMIDTPNDVEPALLDELGVKMIPKPEK